MEMIVREALLCVVRDHPSLDETQLTGLAQHWCDTDINPSITARVHPEAGV